MKPAALLPAGISGPVSVVICCRDEAAGLPSLLADLALAPELVCEVLVVDGGSRDASPQLARLAGARVLHGEPCRGGQLAMGVAQAAAPWLLLLHADIRLPSHWPRLVKQAIQQQHRPGLPATAWAFRLTIREAGPALRLVEAAVLLRCLLRRQPYGDQGLLVEATTLAACGGIHPLPLMEDLDLVLRLGRRGPVRLLGGAVVVSDRRWRRLGVWGTTWTNAQLRRRWRRGEHPERLATLYRSAPGGVPTGDQSAPQEAYQKAQRRSRGSSSQPWAR